MSKLGCGRALHSCGHVLLLAVSECPYLSNKEPVFWADSHLLVSGVIINSFYSLAAGFYGDGFSCTPCPTCDANAYLLFGTCPDIVCACNAGQSGLKLP